MSTSNSKTGQDQALRLLQELRKSFLADLPERFDHIESLILTLLKETFPCPEYNIEFEELYRHIYSLKGSAGTHDIALISHICHQFEDVLIDFGNRISEGYFRLLSNRINSYSLSFAAMSILAKQQKLAALTIVMPAEKSTLLIETQNFFISRLKKKPVKIFTNFDLAINWLHSQIAEISSQ